MKTKAKKILTYLRNNGRAKYAEVGRALNAPLSTIFQHQQITEAKYIAKVTPLIDFKKLGYSLRYFFYITLLKNKQIPLDSPHINSVRSVSNGAQYMIDAYFKDLEQVQQFLEEYESQAMIKAVPILDTLSEEEFMVE